MFNYVILGLGFGDEGKGSIVDYIAREIGQATSYYPTVIRFNGGPQAAHNVVTPDGKHHTFSQFGSGTLAGARTHLSRFVLVEPFALLNEAEHLTTLGVSPFELLTVEPRCAVITPFQRAANRIREHLRGDNKHGTCGVGFGETVADDTTGIAPLRLEWHMLKHHELSLNIMRLIQERKYEEFKNNLDDLARVLPEEVQILRDPNAPELFNAAMATIAKRIKLCNDNAIPTNGLIFEGAQGALLDQVYGFHPHTTWSSTTSSNVQRLLNPRGLSRDDTCRIGVIRAYHTRHGAGPFPTYNEGLTANVPDIHNGSEGWQGNFRVGWFDYVLAKWAGRLNYPLSGVALTCMDRKLTPPGEPNVRLVCECYDNQNFDIRLRKVFDYDEDKEKFDIMTGTAVALAKCKPHYVPSYSDDDFTRIVEQCLGHDVVITSYGMTAKDKKRSITFK